MHPPFFLRTAVASAVSVVIASAATTLSLGAHAQTAAPAGARAAEAAEGGALAPVVITGSSAPEQRWRGAATVDVIDGSELRDGQLQINLSEGLGRVPGLVIRNRENYAQDLQVSIRGYGARSTFGVRGVRLFVDGIPASAPDGSGQAANFPLGSADRVEVVRGPFAGIYGASSGGAILLYTQEGAQPSEVRGGLALGDNGLWRLSAQAVGQTGTAAAPGWSYALDAGKFSTDGARPQSEAHRSTGNVRLSRAHEGGRTTLVFNRQSANALDPQGLSREQFDANPGQTAPQPITFNTRKTVSQTQAGLAWEQRLGNGHRVELMGYAGERSVLQFQSIPPGAQGAPGSSGGVIDLNRDYYGFNARWRLQRDWQGGQLDLSGGLAGDRQTDDRRGFENFRGAQLGVLGALRRDETNRATTLDPYVRAAWTREALTVEGALRRVNARYESVDTFLANGDQSGRNTYSATLPVVGLRYQLAEGLQAFASVGRGLETPTLNEVAYSQGGNAGFNTALNAARTAPRPACAGATRRACGTPRCSTSARRTKSCPPAPATAAPALPTAAAHAARAWSSRPSTAWATPSSPPPTPTCAPAMAPAPTALPPATICPASRASSCLRSWPGRLRLRRHWVACSRWTCATPGGCSSMTPTAMRPRPTRCWAW
nr:TonB-dependent receptor [Hydrogenophaga sp.]